MSIRQSAPSLSLAAIPPAVERIRFQTETGSVYILQRFDTDGMLWRRESATLASGSLRSDAGILVRWPPTIALGERVELLSYPINPPSPRLVRTSRIVAFLEADEPAATPA